VTDTRRAVLALGLALPGPLLLAACGGRRPGGPAAPAPHAAAPGDVPAPGALAPTPACADADDDPTPPQTEGPYFRRSSPERGSLLEAGLPGTRLVVAGTVRTTDCRPVARALLDFWQADDRGQYDTAGSRLRGHQFTDDAGRFRLETIVPGLYAGRTRHLHVKVQAPGRPVLTTQLYFPGEPGNARDGIFDARLLLEAQRAPEASGTRTATFDFVLDLG
jgi:protocatechuate 3,4-dioxygenase beta subunit